MRVSSILKALFNDVNANAVSPAPTAQRPTRSNQRRQRSKPSKPPVKKYGSDRIAIGGYHTKWFPIALPAKPHAPWLQQRIQQLHEKADGGGTNIAAAIRGAVQMHDRTPPGVLKRIWLLTDGLANREVNRIMEEVQNARNNHININTVGFGNSTNYDEQLLRSIANRTHNGKFFAVKTLRELSDALVVSGGTGKPSQRRHRAETTVFAIDCSASMNGPMEGQTKIEVVEEALLHLLHWKQQCFS